MVYYINFPDDRDEKYESFRYPGGEVQVRLIGDAIRLVGQAEEVRVVARITNGEVMALAMLSNAVSSLMTKDQKMSLVLPYFPYGRADRQFTEGDGFGVLTFSKMINTMGYDAVITIDAHSEVPFKHTYNLYNIDPQGFIKEAINRIGNDLTLVLPDEGAHRYNLRDFGLPILQCSKVRHEKTGVLVDFNVPVKELKTKNALIVDDICDGGGTFLGIAKKLSAKDVNLFLYVTHGIFSKGFTELNKYFKSIFTTDSYSKSKLNTLSTYGVDIFNTTKAIDRVLDYIHSNSHKSQFEMDHLEHTNS